MPSLIFVEEPRHVPIAAGLARQDTASRLVALSPAACDALERAALTYTPVDRYYPAFDVVELGLTVGRAMLEAVCRHGDAVVGARSPLARAEGLRPFEAHQYVLNGLIDGALLSAHAVAKGLEAERPRRVYFFETPLDMLTSSLDFHGESIYSRVGPDVARSRGVEVVRIPPPAGVPDRIWRGARAGVAPGRCWVRGLRSPVGFARRAGAIGLWRRLTGPGSGRVLLALDREFDIAVVLEHLYRTGWPDVVFWAGAGLDGDEPYRLFRFHLRLPSVATIAEEHAVREAEGAWAGLRDDRGFVDLFRHEGFTIFPALERRLAYLVERNLPLALGIRARAKAILGTGDVGAVLTNEINSFARVEVARAAKEASIPVIVLQHGGVYGYACAYAHEYCGLKWGDYFLAYGDGVADYFNRRRADPRGPVRAWSIPVGSARLDALRVRLDAGRPVGRTRRQVLYVADNLLTGRGARRLSFAEYDGTRYYCWLRRIVELFRTRSDVDFVFRPYPKANGTDPVVRYLRELNLPNCSVDDVRPLWVLLREAAMVCVDMVGTSLLEALLTPVPIVVLAESESAWIRPEAGALLEERVVVTGSVDEYVRVIEAVLAGPAGLTPAVSSAFRRAYATFLDDGRSVERAAQAVRSIVHERRAPLEEHWDRGYRPTTTPSGIMAGQAGDRGDEAPGTRLEPRRA